MKELGRFCATAGLAMFVLAACVADRATEPDPSYGAPRELTPLHRAAASGDVEAVRSLLAGGADVNARAEGKATPLHFAAMLGNSATVRALLAGNADANAHAEDKITPLHGAAQVGDAATVRALLAGGADVNARTKDKFTPLHVAAQVGSVATVRALIEGGANVSARAKDKVTPLHLAMAAGVYLALKDADTEANVHELVTHLEELAEMSGSNLPVTFDLTEMAAVANLIGTVHRAETIRALLAGGADVNARTKDKFTPLHLAALYGDTVVIRALIEGGANVNAHAKGKFTPLHSAAMFGNAAASEALLDAGGNPNAMASGCGPMDVARLRMKATERSIAPFREAIERLRAAGAQPRNRCKLR